ncbi:MAG TPA: phytanoyl-CoA dioxygenase family protein [Planctomycetota bacterium]|nr:phytanoyl-CoA dioxygenase family protein [Planctomycetota bacterium]
MTTVASAPAVQITAEQKKHFHDEGYLLAKAAIPDEMLTMLREECAEFIAREHAIMDKLGVDQRGANYRNKRYFIAQRYEESKRLPDFIFSDVMADVCRATIGPNAYLFYEQFVIKAAEQGMKFAWHQDSGYVGYPHKPYLTCWCALDAVTEENGTVYMLPYSRAGTRDLIEHWKDKDTTDKIGYGGDDPGDPVIAPAGSIAAFSSLCLHRSGFNTSNAMRRVYVVQYVSEPLKSKDGTGVNGFAVPFLKDGKRVR